MLVSSDPLAILRRLLDESATDDLQAYDGLVDPPPAAATSGAKIPALRDPAAYRIERSDLLDKTPAYLAGGTPPEDTEFYVRHSADLTMKGGTTSGVIYPLAVCQIARRFRLRNVGGASAGAIAAAAAAAAEIGRAATTPGKALGNGHVRPGFVGLADLVAHLTQLDEPDEAKDRYRLAQLFRPAAGSMPVYRLLVAAMRTRFGAIPVLLVGAFGWVSKVVTGLLIFLAVLLAGAAARSGGGLTAARDALWMQPRTVPDWGLAVLLGLAGIVGIGCVLVGSGLLAASLLTRRGRPPNAPAEPTADRLGQGQDTPSGTRPASKPRNWRRSLLVIVGVVLIAVAVAGFGVNWSVLLAAAAWLLLGLFIVLVTSALSFVLRAKGSGFGLIAGASEARRRGPLDRLAGLPTVDARRDDGRPLTQWLSETYSELAGLPQGEVLRFGHLWRGCGYTPGSGVGVEAADRRVNLELITSELVHGRSYRFPMDPPGSPEAPEVLEMSDESVLRDDRPDPRILYVRRGDLLGDGDPLLPAPVIEVLTAASAVEDVYDSTTGEPIDDLYPLPAPEDLPVVFAVRLSMPFPVLFRAVRLYRLLVEPLTVRDELGRPLPLHQRPVTFPQATTPGTGSAPIWAEELWFSDGGITSNFPAHLFDSLLPRWPTFGINLDGYPPGFGRQDVWLPRDWQVRQSFGAPIRHGLAGFLPAIVDTARTWRDNAQMSMPSYRGRIASVRQRADEGGNNLFMRRRTIAALAVRGSFAGTLLRRRFGDDLLWQRHQWLRYRGSVRNLEQTAERVHQATRVGLYERLVDGSGADAVAALSKDLSGNAVDPLDRPRCATDWYTPSDGTYWQAAADMITRIGFQATAPVDTQVPRPAPDLRQVPS